MKTIRAITIILLFLSFTHVCGQDNLGDSPVSPLPSDETYQTIESNSSVPNLRAKPTDVDDSEKAQKVSLDGLNVSGLIIMCLALGLYTIYKTPKRRKINL